MICAAGSRRPEGDGTSVMLQHDEKSTTSTVRPWLEAGGAGWASVAGRACGGRRGQVVSREERTGRLWQEEEREEVGQGREEAGPVHLGNVAAAAGTLDYPPGVEVASPGHGSRELGFSVQERRLIGGLRGGVILLKLPVVEAVVVPLEAVVVVEVEAPELVGRGALKGRHGEVHVDAAAQGALEGAVLEGARDHLVHLLLPREVGAVLVSQAKEGVGGRAGRREPEALELCGGRLFADQGGKLEHELVRNSGQDVLRHLLRNNGIGQIIEGTDGEGNSSCIDSGGGLAERGL